MNYEKEIKREYTIPMNTLLNIILNECQKGYNISHSETATTYSIKIEHLYWESEYKLDKLIHSTIIKQLKSKIYERTKKSN